jgi:uncharacterized membrane protein
MTTEIEVVDVAVPVRTAYNQWTQFEQFPKFMKQVKEVRQVNDMVTHWAVEIGGVRREFDAEIVEQEPDSRIAWKSTSGPKQHGIVSFEALDAGHTRVSLQMVVEPHGLAEHVGDATGMVGRTLRADMESFKAYIESRGMEEGAWRGTVREGNVEGGDDKWTQSSC